MPILTDLPRELRQKILLETLRDEHLLTGDALPKSVTTLLHVCREIRQDMPWVLKAWRPLRFLERPTDLTKSPSIKINGTRYTPRLGSVYISLFHHDASEDIYRFYKDGAIMHRGPIVLFPFKLGQWPSAVPHLPLGIDTIILDNTPAPIWMRQAMSLDKSLFNSKTENRLFFLRLLDRPLALQSMRPRTQKDRHVDAVVDLVERIHVHYEGNIKIILNDPLRPPHISESMIKKCESQNIHVEYEAVANQTHEAHGIPLDKELEEWQVAMGIHPRLIQRY